MQVVNWPLLKNPLNWLIVILMLVIAGMAGHYGLVLFQSHFGSGAESS